MIVGITGGIACGKTEAGKVLMGMGVPVLDADEVAHYISNYEPAIKDAVRTAFGNSAFSDNGLLNRKALGAVVFSVPGARPARRNLRASTYRGEFPRHRRRHLGH
jgi:dephospho-CoA kinase